MPRIHSLLPLSAVASLQARETSLHGRFPGSTSLPPCLCSGRVSRKPVSPLPMRIKVSMGENQCSAPPNQHAHLFPHTANSKALRWHRNSMRKRRPTCWNEQTAPASRPSFIRTLFAYLGAMLWLSALVVVCNEALVHAARISLLV